MELIFSHKKEFGNDRFYPQSGDARLILSLMGRNSMTRFQVSSCKKHGWSVTIEQEGVDI